MIVGNAILMGGSGSGASGYTFSDGILHIWGVRGSHLLETKTISEEGIYAASDDGVEGYSLVNVDFSIRLERLVATLNGTYCPSEGKDGFYEVVIDNPSDGRCQKAAPIGDCDFDTLMTQMSWSNTVS